MSRRTRGWGLLGLAVILLLWAWFLAGFLGEASAVGRVRVALLAIVVASIGAGAAAALGGVWMLVARRV